MLNVEKEFQKKEIEVLFNNQYNSENIFLATTPFCDPETSFRLAVSLEERGNELLMPLHTNTSRDIFLFRGEEILAPYDIICKRSRFSPSAIDLNGVVSPVDEIHANRRLATIVETSSIQKTIPQSSGVSHVSIKTEIPLGFYIDNRQGEVYTLFQYEVGYGTGEDLNYVDPPINGVGGYDAYLWSIRSDIQYLTQLLITQSSEKGLIMHDFGVNQVLYRIDPEENLLDVILIDSERNVVQ